MIHSSAANVEPSARLSAGGCSMVPRSLPRQTRRVVETKREPYHTPSSAPETDMRRRGFNFQQLSTSFNRHFHLTSG
jgi:hypothetical protein